MRITRNLTSDKEFSVDIRRGLSLIFILATVIIFWLPIYKTGQMFLIFDLSKIPFLNMTTPVDLKPELIDGVFGIILIVPLYIRRILYWRKASVYSVLSFVLNLSLASTICVICLGHTQGSLIDVIWPLKDIKILLLLISIMLSWIGMAQFAGLGFIILFIFSFCSSLTVSHAMGFLGFICVVLGTLGIMLQSDMGPHELFVSLKETYKAPISKVKDSYR